MGRGAKDARDGPVKAGTGQTIAPSAQAQIRRR